MPTSETLRKKLHSLDGKSYGALKQLTGAWDFGTFTLHIDKVQSDPYAPASRMHLVIPRQATALPGELTRSAEQRVAAADFIARDLADAIRQGPREYGFVTPGQEILPRSSVVVSESAVQVRFTFQFPAAGRRVKGNLAARLLGEDLFDLVKYSAVGERLDVEQLREHVETYTDFCVLQGQLGERGLVAFVADGAILPRSAGDRNTPLRSALAFESPEEFRVKFSLPSGREVTGMGVRAGITLIAGGGFHGKSTLLRAIERGVYSHVPGDGREFVVTDPTSVMVRAEDGRAVTGTDISPFINNLPGGADTSRFFTANASGSTSQAANLAEALEIGAKTLLIDEDTSATNFMIRDQAMKQLIAAEHEPITPFVDRVRALYDKLGVSTILVVGGSGIFFGVADSVIAMRSYVPSDVTDRAHQIAGGRAKPVDFDFASYSAVDGGRKVIPASLRGNRGSKPPRGRGLEQVQIGKENLDLRYLSQLVDAGQTNAIALALELVARELDHPQNPTQGRHLHSAVLTVIEQLQQQGLDLLVGAAGARAEDSSRVRGDLVLPRAAELHQAISRWRGLKVGS